MVMAECGASMPPPATKKQPRAKNRTDKQETIRRIYNRVAMRPKTLLMMRAGRLLE
jgi:hypothetical protein